MYFIFLLFLTVLNLHAQWVKDGMPFLASETTESIVKLVPDDEGNVFVFWFSLDAGFKIYVSKIDTAGYRMWDTDSLMVCYYPEQQRSYDVAPDGEGGFVVAWRDTRADLGAGDIYAQRVDKDGNLLWDVNGVPAIIAEDYQDDVKMCRLEDTTFIVTCVDERIGFNKTNIYAQRLDRYGNMLWNSAGIRLTLIEGKNMYFNWQQKLISSNKNTFIMVWNLDDWDHYYTDIYAQKIDEEGNLLWDSLGIPVANLPYSQGEFGDYSICSDGAGGVVVAWHDERDYWNHGVYVQRVDSTGHCVWQDNGILQPGSYYHPTIILADSMKYLLFWNDISIHVQKIDEQGKFLFGTYGKKISYDTTGWGADYPYAIKTDDEIIIVWRRGNSDGIVDLYSQKIDFSGNRLWDVKDIPVCTAYGDQYNIKLCSDLHGGAYVAWIDERDMPNHKIYDAYLQRIYADGRTGGVTGLSGNKPAIPLKPVLFQNYPNPFNESTVISFYLPKPMPITLTIFNLQGQKIKTLIPNQTMKGDDHQIIWNGKNENQEPVSTGVYFLRLRTSDLQIIKKMIYLR